MFPVAQPKKKKIFFSSHLRVLSFSFPLFIFILSTNSLRLTFKIHMKSGPLLTLSSPRFSYLSPRHWSPQFCLCSSLVFSPQSNWSFLEEEQIISLLCLTRLLQIQNKVLLGSLHDLPFLYLSNFISFTHLFLVFPSQPPHCSWKCVSEPESRLVPTLILVPQISLQQGFSFSVACRLMSKWKHKLS